MRYISTLFLASALGTSLVACELDVPDLNNPGLDDLESNPSAAAVTAACTGLIIGNRGNMAAANGYVAQLGILGREAYNFDQADPRFVKELLEGPLSQGSPFGGNFWAGPYANIRLANIVERGIDKVAEFSTEDKKALSGFANTIEALDLLEVINARDTNGAVIDTDKEIGQLGAIVDKPAVFAEIARLLDDAAASLAAGGMKFPFALPGGYAGFDDPAGFLKFNRAIRARVAAYTKDYATMKTALDASFIDEDPAMASIESLEVGVFHTYSTGAGDTTNALINPNIFAHPSIKTDAQMNGTTPDARLTRKVKLAKKPGQAQGLTSDQVFTIYTSPSSSVPIIRNEELVLLRAEQLFFQSARDVAGALAALNLVRTTSGGLLAITGTPTEAQFTDALLYERRYSLLFEGGHRLIDTRRLDKTSILPLDKPDVSVRNIRFPIPLAECNARPGEQRCTLGSQ